MSLRVQPVAWTMFVVLLVIHSMPWATLTVLLVLNTMTGTVLAVLLVVNMAVYTKRQLKPLFTLLRFQRILQVDQSGCSLSVVDNLTKVAF